MLAKSSTRQDCRWIVTDPDRSLTPVNSPRQIRQGFTLVELLVAGGMLSVVATLVLSSLIWVGKEQRGHAQQQEALAEIGNVMERLTVRPWESLTDESVNSVPLPENLRQQLPDAMLKAGISTDAALPDAKRITVELSWKNRSGQRNVPLRLVAWVYRKGGQE